MSLVDEIKKQIKGEVFNDEETLKKYSRDTSLLEVKPEIVVWPNDAEDIKSLVRFVTGNKERYPNLSLTARSAGTDMTGGPLNESIVLDFTKHFTKIKEIGTDFAVVEPGVYYRDFEKETLKHSLLLPCFPASRELCALGGMVANNAAGEMTLSYGKMERYVKELKVVLADGNEYTVKPLTEADLKFKISKQDFEGQFYRKVFELVSAHYDELQAAKPKVSKNSSGYFLWNVWDKERKVFDLNKLIVGSQGTLGIVTEIKVGLIKPHQHSKMLVVFMRNLKDLGKVVNKVLQYHPETFESYDDHTLRLAISFMPEFVKRLKTNVLSLAFEFLPEFFTILTGGLPKLVLTAEFTADDEMEALAKAQKAESALAEFGLQTHITHDKEEIEKYHMIRRESFNLLRQKVKDKQTAPFIDDIIVSPYQLPKFLPKLETLLHQYNIIYTIAGHIGDGNFHIIPLMNLEDPHTAKIVETLGKKVYELVFEYGGSMSAEHNDGLIRSPYLPEMFGPKVYQLFVQTKNIFDPTNIFNPGKKVNASFKYEYSHLKHGA